jgi:dihydroorotate dehydrogenase electron transfer subunit
MKGFVTDILKSESVVQNSQVYACGPDPMLARVHQICKKRNAGCQVSVETMMACGMGACLGCNIPARDGSYAHVCIDGPVFNAEDLVWNL